jgi:hypothetical protein
MCLHVQVGQSDLAREGSVRLTCLAKAVSPFHLATTVASFAYHLRNNHERQGLASRLQVVCTYIYRVHCLVNSTPYNHIGSKIGIYTMAPTKPKLAAASSKATKSREGSSIVTNLKSTVSWQIAGIAPALTFIYSDTQHKSQTRRIADFEGRQGHQDDRNQQDGHRTRPSQASRRASLHH